MYETRGYPIDHRLRAAHLAQRGPSFSRLRAVMSRVRKGWGGMYDSLCQARRRQQETAARRRRVVMTYGTPRSGEESRG
jgi:hypothetical protein